MINTLPLGSTRALTHMTRCVRVSTFPDRAARGLIAGVIGAPTVYDHLTKAQCKAIGEGRIRAVHAVCTVSSGDLVAALTSPDCIVRTLE